MNPAVRKDNTLRKLERMNTALRHEEPDRVPISRFLLGRASSSAGGASSACPPTPRLSPTTTSTGRSSRRTSTPGSGRSRCSGETPDEVVVKTGFGATVHKRFAHPMPEMRAWDIDTFDKLERAEFDDPADRRRFFDPVESQINNIGDGYVRNTPAWIASVKAAWPDFPGLRQHHRDERMPDAPHRPAQLHALDGGVPGADGRGARPHRGFLLPSDGGADRARPTASSTGSSSGATWPTGNRPSCPPRYWRAHFKPVVARLVELAHAHGLPVIYHGCGNVSAIFEDFIEIGVDAYNPLEAKAGFDAVDLRRRFGHRIAFCGNGDVRVWETGDRAAIRRDVLHKLNAARGGGFIFASDHSVTSGVSGATYDYIVGLVREAGRYPLSLGEFAVEV